MLFYNQIKKEFHPQTWKKGQIYFREDRVKNVRAEEKTQGQLISAKIQGSHPQMYDSQIFVFKGKILKSNCSCPAYQKGEQYCKHVAALSHWILEKGSLLRAGIKENEEENSAIAAESAALVGAQSVLNHSLSTRKIPPMDEARPLPVRGEPVLYVRGIFLNRNFNGLSLEPAVQYTNPETREVQVEPMKNMMRQSELRVWKTPLDVHVKLSHEFVPILLSVDAAKIIHQGPKAAFEAWVQLLKSKPSGSIVFHPSIAQVRYDPEPLKLNSLYIGDRQNRYRQLKYEFRNSSQTIYSDELQELAEKGQLSNQYVWKGSVLYRLDPTLNTIARYTNRSGVAHSDAEQKDEILPFHSLRLDDDQLQPLHPLAAFRLSLELGVEDFKVDPLWVEFHEWKKLFEKKKIPKLPEVDYGFDLREYQHNGLNWLWSLYHRGLSALLADDMGLGKTHQVLALLTSVYTSRQRPKEPSLVIAPTSVVAAWAQKLERYPTKLKWQIFHGKDRQLKPSEMHLVLTTYGILQKEVILRDQSWHLVILDEAQAIKNASTISSRASRVLKSKFKIAMTGTPVENQSTDLWSVMEFLLPGYLGSMPRFKRLYGSGREIPSAYQADALKRLISPFLLRRTKSQVLTELPEKTEEVLSCELTAYQKKVYRAFLQTNEAERLRENLQNKTNKIDYASILALLTRLKQVCDHPRLPDFTSGTVKTISHIDPQETGKWEVFEELVREALGSDLKVVVFTQYLGMMDIILNWLRSQNIDCEELRGDTPDRAQRLKRFSEDIQCKVFVCSLLAGGLGIDLTSASVCIHFDRWWNPAKENQATDRLHRIGQTRGVQVFKLQIPGTIEDRIAQIIQSKVALSGALIEESPVGLKSFSREELLELLTEPV